MGADQAQNLVKHGIHSQSVGSCMKGCARPANRGREMRIVRQCRAKAKTSIARKSEYRPEPQLGQIEHAVGEAFAAAGIPVVLFLRLNEDHPSRCAAVTFASAEKLLHPMLGRANKPVIVPMQIVGMGIEAGTNGFDATCRITHETHEIVRS